MRTNNETLNNAYFTYQVKINYWKYSLVGRKFSYVRHFVSMVNSKPARRAEATVSMEFLKVDSQ